MSAPMDQQPVEPGALPKQIADMLDDIKQKITGFGMYPPHTLQRLSELVLSPRAHYKALASYLHAVDRVIQVTSGTDIYPLPPAIPDMSSIQLNGEDAKDPAAAITWANPTTAAVGSDEALGGALLTPIPWLTKRSPESGDDAPGATIHSESTETIDGPNGMGSIETVSVSVNGVPSTGHSRGITQGELLRQEQRAGVVPVSQLARTHDTVGDIGGRSASTDEEGHLNEDGEEIPHARGPEEIGIDDTGLQTATTSHIGEDGGVEMEGIDIEAAVGRKHDEKPIVDAASTAVKDGDAYDIDDNDNDATPQSPGAESVGSKREADETPDGEIAAKKVKEGTEAGDDSTTTAPTDLEPETKEVAPVDVEKEMKDGDDDNGDNKAES